MDPAQSQLKVKQAGWQLQVPVFEQVLSTARRERTHVTSVMGRCRQVRASSAPVHSKSSTCNLSVVNERQITASPSRSLL